MNYDSLIETISLMVENEKINTKGLIMTYELSEEEHLNLNVDLFYKTNPNGNFQPTNDFEVEIGGILIKFVKKLQD